MPTLQKLSPVPVLVILPALVSVFGPASLRILILKHEKTAYW
jgi:hypothetical protein